MRTIIQKILDKLKNKSVIQEMILNESFDKPFNSYKKIDDFNYIVVDTYNNDIVKINFKLSVNDLTGNDCFITKPKDIYEISCDWISDDYVIKENYKKLTTTLIPVIDNFINEIDPDVIVLNSGVWFENFKIEYKGLKFEDKLWLLFTNHHINKQPKNRDVLYVTKKQISKGGWESMIKTHKQCGGDFDDIREHMLNPKKNNLRGIKLRNYKENQIRRIILRDIYLKNERFNP